MDKIDPPQVTVVISTRNRAERIVKAVQTILENDYPHFEVRVIDQSEDDLTETSLRTFLGNPRFHYMRTHIKGISAGRNLGIDRAQTEFIGLTDDDCETPKNWLKELMVAFAVNSRIGIVFGNVLSGPYDSRAGFTPTYLLTKPLLAVNIRDKHRVEGISACMGIRRSLWEKLGGFDEMLGTGGPFKSAEDTDFTIRALLAGYFVYETPNVRVVHQGFRTWEEGRNLIGGYLYGIGAVFAKQLKCGHWSVIQVLTHLMWRWAFGHPVVEFGHFPSRWLRLIAFMKGFLAGAINPVDRNTSHFILRHKGS